MINIFAVFEFVRCFVFTIFSIDQVELKLFRYAFKTLESTHIDLFKLLSKSLRFAVYGNSYAG